MLDNGETLVTKMTPVQPDDHRRRGSIYVVVLGTSMLVTVIGVSALMATRIERTYVEGCNDLEAARLHAHSAIEMGYFWINNDPDWRTTRANGIWLADQPIGTGTFTLAVIDPDDGDLKSEPNNRIVLTGTGIEGDTRFKLAVTFAVVDGGYEVTEGSWKQVID